MFDKKKNLEAQQAFGEAVNTGDLAAFDGLVAAGSVDHDPAPGQQAGPAGFAAMFGEMRTAFPDLAIEVETILAEDDKVAFAYTITGTNTGQYQGFESTGKAISVRGMQISRFEDGKLAERWGSSDELGILKQLGLIEL